MALRINHPGIQMTLQAQPRVGLRHLGVPSAGPADTVSMALANHLCGNDGYTPALEITLGQAAFTAEQDMVVAFTGAPCSLHISNERKPFHMSHRVKKGDTLRLGAPAVGMRSYLAVAGGFVAKSVLGSASTYLPAQLGGLDGYQLRSGDQLDIGGASEGKPGIRTPEEFRPSLNKSTVLRALPSCEYSSLHRETQATLFTTTFSASRQIDRMGVRLEGLPTVPRTGFGQMNSVPVFPGTVQFPDAAQPIILGCDAQTTGGYPRVLAVAKVDLPLVGQIAPGTSVQFFHRTFEQALEDLEGLRAHYAVWMPVDPFWL